MTRVLVALCFAFSATAFAQGPVVRADQVLIQQAPAKGFMPIGATNLHSVRASNGNQPGYPNLSALFGITSDLSESHIQALEGFAYTNQSGTTTLSLGTIGTVEHQGVGTTTHLRAMQAGNYITGTGGGTNATAFFAAPSGRVFNGTGTYTNGYGLYVDTFLPGFTNKYGVYVADATAKNYFAGSVSIGTGTLYVEGGALKFRSEAGTVTTLAPR